MTCGLCYKNLTPQMPLLLSLIRRQVQKDHLMFLITCDLKLSASLARY